jgi:ankyrin repeat protein
MCTKLSDSIVTFDVSGTPVKIPTEKLALHPESLLTMMVHNKVQPASGFAVNCCPKVFGYLLRFVLHDMQVDPMVIANKLATTEFQVRKVIDGFQFKGIYVNDMVPIVPMREVLDAKNRACAEELHKKIWSIAAKGQIEKLNFIIDHGLDLEVPCPDYGSTALMYAAQNGHLDCVMQLIDHGASVQARNKDGFTPLHFATTVDIVRVLLKHGAGVNAVNGDKQTPLHYVFRIAGRNNDVFKELINNGADLNIPDINGKTPLHVAIRSQLKADVIISLITKDVNLNAKTNENNTLLHIAASGQPLRVVKHLLQLGADPHVKNNAGDDPLMVAAKYSRCDIVTELYLHMNNQKV